MMSDFKVHLLTCRPFHDLTADEFKFHDNPSLIRFMSCGGVFDLIKNRRLLFSPISKFRQRDPSEGLGGLPLRPHMRGYGRRIYGSGANSYSEYVKPSRHFPQEFWEKSERKDFSLLKQKILWAKKETEGFLCSCFHLYHEEPYAMWELYGFRGEGLAIYTDKESVLQSLPHELQDDLLIGWGSIFYAFNLAHAAAVIWENEFPPEALIRIKSSRFQHEQEFRLYVRAKEPKEQIHLPFNPQAIRAIVLGPRLSASEREGLRSGFLDLVKAERLSTKIVDSEETEIRRLVEG